MYTSRSFLAARLVFSSCGLALARISPRGTPPPCLPLLMGVHRRADRSGLEWSASSTTLSLSGALFYSRRYHGHKGCEDKPLSVTFVLADGTEKKVVAHEGQTLLDVAAEHHLPMEGACAGSCACSTCHVYLEEENMDDFPEPTDAENDMIDQAFFPEPTSRLGCQLTLQQDKHDGLKVTLPKATRNMYVDGAVAVPH